MRWTRPFVIFGFLLAGRAEVSAVPFAYVANATGNSVTVVDEPTRTVVATPSANNPFGVAMHPTLSLAYVGEQGDTIGGTVPASIAVFDTSTHARVATVSLPAAPTGIAVNGTGTRLYVATMGNEVRSYTAAATPVLQKTIPVGPRPYGVAFLANGLKAYVARANGVDVIDMGSETVVASIPMFGTPLAIVSHPNSSRIYISAGTLNGTLIVVDTATNTIPLGGIISVGKFPSGVAITPDGSRIYVASEDAGTVTEIASASLTVSATITGFSRPYGLSVNQLGSILWVVNRCAAAFCSTNSPSKLSIVDVPTRTVVNGPTVGIEPLSLGRFLKP